MYKAIAKWFKVTYAPYHIEYIGYSQLTEVHYAWTYKDAMEWVACSLRCEEANVFKYSKFVSGRSVVIEA